MTNSAQWGRVGEKVLFHMEDTIVALEVALREVNVKIWEHLNYTLWKMRLAISSLQHCIGKYKILKNTKMSSVLFSPWKLIDSRKLARLPSKRKSLGHLILLSSIWKLICCQ